MSPEARKHLPDGDVERLQLAVEQLVQSCDELEQSRDYYKTLFDDQPVGRVVFDGAGLVKAINVGAATLLGREPAALLGKPFIVYVAEGYRRVFLDHLRRAKSDLPEAVRDTLDLGVQGRFVSVELHTRAFERHDGLECNTALITLPADRRGAAGIDKLAPLLAQANDAIIVRTLDGRILGWNPAAERLYGFAEREVLGANVLPLLGPNPVSLFKESEAELARTSRWSGTLACRRRDGTRVTVETRWGLVRNAEGVPQAVIQVDRDVTSRQTLAIEERNRLRRESGTQPDLADLASALAYDVQEPLRGLVGYLELLKRRYRGQAGKEADEFAELALSEAGRLESMIEDIRLYCRAASRHEPPELTPASDALEAALGALRPAIAASQANVRRSQLPVVRVVPAQLREVLTRLLSNALKFRDGKPVEVEVSSRAVGTLVEISIRDNGIGIPVAERDRLFRPFGRLHTTEEYPGHGMGLAIARRIVEHWGGRIWFESKPGEGSTFSFTVPSGTAPEEEQGPSSSE